MMRKARPFHPPANRESYKDLLIFEERLKQNAERLQKQRRKYQGFLVSLVGVIVYLAYIVFLQPSIYSLVHYSNVACLLVAATTLILFFATGMYSDKIAYAYKFVPQANRALRPFNIYLNTRHKSKFSSFFNFFSSSTPRSASTVRSPSLSRSPSGRSISSTTSEDQPNVGSSLSRQTSASSIRSATSFRSTTALHSASPSPSVSPSSSPPSSPRPSSSLPLPVPTADGPVTRAPPSPTSTPMTPRPTTGVPIPPIPPTENPRGELIFSNRVNPTFREGYERYRGEWEKRRKEAKELEGSRKKGNGGWWRIWSRSGSGGSEGVSASTGSKEEREKGNEKEAERGRRMGGSVSGDSSRFNSRSNSTERPPPQSSSESARVAAEALLSSVSTSVPPLDDSSTPPSDSTSLAPLDSDDPSSTSTPPPQSKPPSSTSPSKTTVNQSSAHGVQTRIRAESFSELLELEAANEEEGEEGGAGGPPTLTRSNSIR